MDAKAVAQDGEDEIVAAIPEDTVIRVNQRPKGSLLSCKGDGNWRWAGGTSVKIDRGASLPAVIDEVVARVSQRDDWTVSPDDDAIGDPGALFEGPDGARYVIGIWDDKHLIEIFSFSPCAHLQGDESPHGYW